MRKICLKLNCPFIEICPENNNYEVIDNVCVQAKKIKEVTGINVLEDENSSLKTKLTLQDMEISRLEENLQNLKSEETSPSEYEEKIDMLQKENKKLNGSRKLLIKQNGELTNRINSCQIDKLGLKKEGMKKLWQKARDNSEEINGEKYISISRLKSLI